MVKVGTASRELIYVKNKKYSSAGLCCILGYNHTRKVLHICHESRFLNILYEILTKHDLPTFVMLPSVSASSRSLLHTTW